MEYGFNEVENQIAYYIFPPSHLSLSLESFEVEAALDRMIDRYHSGAQGSKASAEELASILGLTDRETAVKVCGLYSKVEAFFVCVCACV